jgi:hypothetical protein
MIIFSHSLFLLFLIICYNRIYIYNGDCSYLKEYTKMQISQVVIKSQ